MKKILMLLLGAMLVLSMAGGVAAAVAGEQTPAINQDSLDSDGKANQYTTVTLALEQSFEVTLPANFDMTDDDNDGIYTGLAWVNATVHLLEYGKKLTVNATSENLDETGTVHQLGGSNNVWKLQLGNERTYLEYVIRIGNAGDHIDLGATNTWYMSGQNIISRTSAGSDSVAMHFKLKSDIGTATVGTYTDTLTFTVAIVNA